MAQTHTDQLVAGSGRRPRPIVHPAATAASLTLQTARCIGYTDHTMDWRLRGGQRTLRVDGKIRVAGERDRGKAMTQDIPSDAADRAHALFGDLIEGRWEEVRGEFDVRLSDHVVMDELARGWRNMADSAGSFERIGAPVTRQSGDYTVVDVPLIAGRGEATGEMVFDADGKAAGLALKYPRRHRLDPRRVHVLKFGNPR